MLANKNFTTDKENEEAYVIDPVNEEDDETDLMMTRETSIKRSESKRVKQYKQEFNPKLLNRKLNNKNSDPLTVLVIMLGFMLLSFGFAFLLIYDFKGNNQVIEHFSLYFVNSQKSNSLHNICATNKRLSLFSIENGIDGDLVKDFQEDCVRELVYIGQENEKVI